MKLTETESPGKPSKSLNAQPRGWVNFRVAARREILPEQRRRATTPKIPFSNPQVVKAPCIEKPGGNEPTARRPTHDPLISHD